MPRDRVLPVSQIFRAQSTEWQPLLDIYELKDGWLLKADLAGVHPKDVSVSVVGCRVTIRGSRRDSCIEEGCCHYRMEISYSQFERSVELPDDPGPCRVQTEFQEGMLLIRIRRGNANS